MTTARYATSSPRLSTAPSTPAARCSAVFSQLANLNNNSIYSDNFGASCTNREAWKSVQNSSDTCKNVIKYLQTGREPTKKVGDIFNEIRQYVREASIAKDGLLVIKQEINLLPPGAVKERIVVPTSMAGGLLFHLELFETDR